MRNLSMERKLKNREAIDLSACARSAEGEYIMPPGMFIEGLDYCDAETERWMWSIGRNRETGEVRASITTKFYEAKGWECLWLR